MRHGRRCRGRCARASDATTDAAAARRLRRGRRRSRPRRPRPRRSAMPHPGPTSWATAPATRADPKRRVRRAALVADLVPRDRRPRSTPMPRRPRAPGPTPAPCRPARRSRPARPSVPRSTPPVRKLARDLGIDLADVTGTGERGLITRADVEAAASGTAGARRGRRARRRASGDRAGGCRPPGRDAHPDQGRAQAHRGRDGAQRVHRAARHRVPHDRRHRDDGAAPRHPRRPRVRRAQGDAAHGRREGRLHRRASHARGELALGRGRAGDRAVRRREPRHRRGDRAAASSCRT